ncbi:MAG: DUF362 domain-containing protein [Chloroflexota bacterium]
MGLAVAGAVAAGCQPAPAEPPLPTDTSLPTPTPTVPPTFTPLPPTPSATPAASVEVAATSTASVPWNPLGTVVIGQQAGYERRPVKETLQQMIEDMGGLHWTVPPGGKVALKVCLPAAGNAAERHRFGTHPEVVRALGELLLDAGAGKLLIVEALADPGAFTAWGYDEIAETLNAALIDLNLPAPYAEFGEMAVGSAALVYEKFAVNQALNEVDSIISLAKMKCHSALGIALSMQNLAGMVPYTRYRLQDADNYPSAFYEDVKPQQRSQVAPRVIIDLNMAFPLNLALIDGIQTVQGGESDAVPGVEPIDAGLLLVGQNPTCVDAVATLAMGFDPLARFPMPPFLRSDNYLNLAYNLGLGTNLPEQIEVLGPALEEIIVPFAAPAL